LGMLASSPGLELQTIGLPVSFDGVRPAMHRPAPSLAPHEAWSDGLVRKS
jgi:hypothetical protein